MVLGGLPIVGYYYKKMHAWYHEKTHHKCHHHDSAADHVEHESAMAVVVNIPDPPGLTRLTMEEVDERFGQLATILLMFDRKFLLGTEFFPEAETFTWFVGQDNKLSARWNGIFFDWNDGGWVRRNEQNS
jgi:hypothetical protein